jgi:dTDP-D-glucose 4,6-dehydratase
MILEKGQIGEIYNIGSDDHHEYTVTQIAHMLIEKITGTKDYDKWISYVEDRPFNDKRYYISNQKVKDLGWSININFDKGIDELIQSVILLK